MKHNIGLKTVTFGVAAATLLAWQPAISTAQTIDVKIGYPTTADPQHDLALKLVSELKKRSNGRIQGRVFPTSQLGKIPRQVEGIQLGTQEVFLAPPGFLVGVNQAFQVTDAPALFADAKHGQRTITDPAFRTPFLKLAESKGIVGGNIWIYDGTSYGSTVAINKLADLRGLKIRVLATPMERAVPKMFGAAGVPIPFTEVVPALQRHVVDAARTSLVVMAGAKFHSICKFLTVTNDGYIAAGTWYSKVWLNKQPADIRKILLDTAKDLEGFAASNALSFVKVKTQEWRDKGATVTAFSAAEQKQYMDTIRPLGDKLLGAHKNPQVRKMYGLLKASAQRNAM